MERIERGCAASSTRTRIELAGDASSLLGPPPTAQHACTHLRHTAACTGDRPGVTKHLQAVQLDKGITLLDSPGVVVESAADGVTSEAGCNSGTQFVCFTSTQYKH